MKRWICMFGMALALPLMASEPPALPRPAATLGPALTLAEATELAWLRLPYAKALPGRLAEARANERVADGWSPAPPALSVAHLGDRLNARTGKQEWEAEIAVPLWLPGQQRAQQSLAQSQQVEIGARTATQRLEMAGRLREAWWELAAARQAVTAAARRTGSAAALHADVARRWRAGDLPRTDANTAQSELHAAEAEALAAARAEGLAADRLRALVGAAAPVALPAETAAAPDAGVDAHPALAAADSAARSARLRVRLADHSGRDAPEVALRLVRERGNAGEPFANAIGIKFSLPLSSPARVGRDSNAARAELAEAEAQVELLRQQLALDAVAARRDIEAATRRGALAASRATLGKDTLQLTQKAFDLGEAELQTLLRARAAGLDAEAELERSALDRAAAISRLRQALGVMP